jgi:predicted GIY-YIG superfamily endonuclease
MHYVYILRSLKDVSYYVGSTQDLKKRIIKHNNGEVTYSAKKKPWKLVWYCAFPTKKQAVDFEMYLKQGSGFAFARKHLVLA